MRRHDPRKTRLSCAALMVVLLVLSAVAAAAPDRSPDPEGRPGDAAGPLPDVAAAHVDTLPRLDGIYRRAAGTSLPEA